MISIGEIILVAVALHKAEQRMRDANLSFHDPTSTPQSRKEFMDAFERATEECEDAMSVFERDDLLLLSAAKKIIEGRAYDWTSDDRQTIARMRALAQDLGATVSERNYGCPLRAKSGLMQCSKKKSYSITSSTRPISVSGC